MSFLRRPAFGNAFKDDMLAKEFVNGVRNGILHEAETRKWVIWRDEPKGRIVEKEQDGFALNRTLNKALRIRFKKKMNDIFKEA
jgi:Leu/Phe-tRNA-protein transferase